MMLNNFIQFIRKQFVVSPNDGGSAARAAYEAMQRGQTVTIVDENGKTHTNPLEYFAREK